LTVTELSIRAGRSGIPGEQKYGDPEKPGDAIGKVDHVIAPGIASERQLDSDDEDE
jgi:hypothetical protein